jgi:cytochrome P450
MAIENFEDADLDTLATGFPRMSSFIYEVLRLRGPVAINSFMSQVPIEIDGTVLPAKSNFLVLYRTMSKNGTSAPRGPRNSPPSEFCGRRWLTGSSTSLSANKPTFKTGYRAFGEGVRVCPGRELAETELLVFLVSILRAFELELEPDHPPMSYRFRLSVCQDINTRLLLKPRVA